MTTKPAVRGFTMIELLTVIIIIGIVIALIVTAAVGGIRRAEERATQGLISKLETGLDDRLQALLQTQPDYNQAHAYMAGVYAAGMPEIPGLQRVNVIARHDQMKAEIPDVFLLSYTPTTVGTPPDYPLNFAAQPFQAGSASTNLPGAAATYASYFLPLGNGYFDSPANNSYGAAPINVIGTNWNPNGTGIFGASYTAAAGLYKNLGYAPAGYDGADNNQNGLIDEYAEGILGLNQAQVAQITTNLFNHTHKTARAEVLYALLVEGQGPLGSTFNRDDFTGKEVQDTDGDGLPEFVDGWGEPLQFYRWPIYYHSDLQRGVPVNNNYNAQSGSLAVGNGFMNYPYLGVFDPREQDPLDPSQQLMAPSWWSSQFNSGTSATLSYGSVQTGSAPLSPGATAFSTFFHPLLEPMISAGVTNSASPQHFWDRGATYYQRRAFFTKFLIVSSGPDQQLGIARLDTLTPLGTQISMPTFSAGDVLIESQARLFNLYDATNSALKGSPDANPSPPLYGGPTLNDAAQDDISNHNYQAPGGVTQ
jgi:prepilin-type N-terminal cleavage/methylation domain-containing protein